MYIRYKSFNDLLIHLNPNRKKLSDNVMWLLDSGALIGYLNMVSEIKDIDPIPIGLPNEVNGLPSTTRLGYFE